MKRKSVNLHWHINFYSLKKNASCLFLNFIQCKLSPPHHNVLSFTVSFFFLFFATGSCYVAQVGFRLFIFPSQLPKCWGYRCTPSRLDTGLFFWGFFFFFFWDRVSSQPGVALTVILLISVSEVARITGINHRRPAQTIFNIAYLPIQLTMVCSFSYPHYGNSVIRTLWRLQKLQRFFFRKHS
jgi:hypothetical protein